MQESDTQKISQRVEDLLNYKVQNYVALAYLLVYPRNRAPDSRVPHRPKSILRGV